MAIYSDQEDPNHIMWNKQNEMADDKQLAVEYLPFRITEYNETRQDTVVQLNSEVGSLWVKVGKVNVEIKQTEDGLGVIVEAFDSESCQQELGTMQVWYDDVIDYNEKDTDSEYPIH